MTSKSLGKLGRKALLASPLFLAPASFFAVIHWLKPRNTAFVLVLTAVVAIFVMGYATLLARRVQRTLDEVQIANQGYASFHAYVWGACISVLLLMLPPVSNLLIDLADVMTRGAPDITTRHRTGVLLGLNFGLMLVVLTQMVCMIVASVIWQRRMNGMPGQE